ncbi:MAG TPA: MBL fold metallo-hydrolase, partial [Gemmatimonadales bacterium]
MRQRIRLALCCLIGFLPVAAAAQTRVVLLGTGTPNADPVRSGPSLAIVVRGSVYLVDAGPGVVRRAELARQHGIDALTQPNLKIVFITHLHSDHTLGLPDLIFTPWVLDRTAPLEVYGPKGIKAMTAHLTAAYIEDVHVRTDGWQPQNTTGYRVIAHEIEPGVIYRDSNVTVTAFSVPHGSMPSAFGYRFETADRTIVVSGDTGPTTAVIAACNGCDLLIHEVYSERGLASRTADWKRYHRHFHTSSSELAHVATEAH